MAQIDFNKRHLIVESFSLKFPHSGFSQLLKLWPFIELNLQCSMNWSKVLSCIIDKSTAKVHKHIVEVDGARKIVSFSQSIYYIENEMLEVICSIQINLEQFQQLGKSISTNIQIPKSFCNHKTIIDQLKKVHFSDLKKDRVSLSSTEESDLMEKNSNNDSD